MASARAISSRRRFAYDSEYAGWSQRYPASRWPKNDSTSAASARASRSSRLARGSRSTDSHGIALVWP